MRPLLALWATLSVGAVFAQTPATTPTPGTTLNTQEKSPETQQFVQRAAQIHMTQAHLGDLANKNATSDELKNLGEQFAKENRDAYQRLGQITDQLAITIPKSIDPAHQKDIQRMEGLTGNAFDRQYKQYVTQNAQKQANWFRQEANKLLNPDLKKYASDQAANYDEQYKRAQEIGKRKTTAANMTGISPSESVQHEIRGTVTEFQNGKSLTVKTRDRVGKHQYDLTSSNLRADVPNDLQPGTPVVITEQVDPNGFNTLEVRRDVVTQRESGPQTQKPNQNPNQ